MPVNNKIDNFHTEISIKVNALVDKHIAPLVEALNEFPNLITVDSCEGAEDRFAYVFFRYCGKPADGAMFYEWLGRQLGERQTADETYQLRVEWRTGHTEPLVQFRIHPDQIDRFASTLRMLAHTGGRGAEANGSMKCKAYGSSQLDPIRPLAAT